MKTICLDPVTPPLLIAGSLSFVTVDEPPPVVHACPPEAEESGLMACCGRTPFEKPGDRITLEPSQVTCPDGWIGQRVAIYAKPIAKSGLSWNDERVDLLHGAVIDSDAIVGSGTLAEAFPIRQGACNERTDHICRTRDGRLLIHRTSVAQADISDQLPLQDWTPSRWALRFTDVTPTIPCPDCNGDGIDGSDDAARFYAYSGKLSTCDTCDGMGTVAAPVVAPVLSGDERTYKEWTAM